MRFLGSEQSLHISSHPETACATLDMLFPLVWVCYLFISSFIHFLHSIVFESSHTSSRQFFCPWRSQRFLMKNKSSKSGLLCFHLPYHKHKHTHSTSLKPVHVQFSSVTESNQLCHPRHKSPSTPVAPGPDGNRPCSVALASVS